MHGPGAGGGREGGRVGLGGDDRIGWRGRREDHQALAAEVLKEREGRGEGRKGGRDEVVSIHWLLLEGGVRRA